MTDDLRTSAEVWLHNFNGGSYKVEIKGDGRMSVYSSRDAGGSRDIDIPALFAWAKAGCPEPGKAGSKGFVTAYEYVCERFGITEGSIAEFIQALAAARDDLTVRTIVAEAECEILKTERDALKARVKELEGEWPKWKFACYPAPKPKLPPSKRCVDCEHLDLGSVESGKGNCIQLPEHGPFHIYVLWYCGAGFTNAALGCGSLEQAMRAELIRVHDEGAK